MQQSNSNKVKKLSHFSNNNKLFNYLLILIILFVFVLVNVSIFQLLCIDGSSLIWFKIFPFLSEKFQDILDTSFYSFIDSRDTYPKHTNINYINEINESLSRKSASTLNKTTGTKSHFYPGQLQINTKDFIRALWNMNLMEYPDMHQDTPIVIHFDAYIEQSNVTFIPLQSKLFVVPEEPMLAFFRLENNTTEPLYLTSVYSVFPNEVIPHVLKLQCFCYENVFLRPGESVNLPILFSISDELLEVYKTKTNSINICIQYTLLSKHS